MLELRKSVIEDAGAFVEMEHTDDTKDFIIPYPLEQHRILIDSNDVIYLSLYYENELSGL
ncbi:hypothetical protein [Vibrio vulnificus]|uniref:hypothetical protein n=1 Tax=Vibrio vulnificus TaxID=672 RepID=UPI001F508908|nr:hypothetical protein [Vibrio vulnificus]